jgi:hypothetical protein
MNPPKHLGLVVLFALNLFGCMSGTIGTRHSVQLTTGSQCKIEETQTPVPGDPSKVTVRRSHTFMHPGPGSYSLGVSFADGDHTL